MLHQHLGAAKVTHKKINEFQQIHSNNKRDYESRRRQAVAKCVRYVAADRRCRQTQSPQQRRQVMIELTTGSENFECCTVAVVLLAAAQH